VTVSNLRHPPSHSQLEAPHHSFDHLIGAGEQGERYCDAEHLGGFEINRQFESGQLEKGNFSRLGTFENCVNFVCRAAKQVLDVRPSVHPIPWPE
jgi:hypothetical protein